MKYAAKPAIVDGCDCEYCKAARHIYFLYRLPATGKNESALSLQLYSSAEECKRKHFWGIQFRPDATWEDGTPVVEPEPIQAAHPDGRRSGTEGRVRLDGKMFGKWAEKLKRHWLPQDSSR